MGTTCLESLVPGRACLHRDTWVGAMGLCTQVSAPAGELSDRRLDAPLWPPLCWMGCSTTEYLRGVYMEMCVEWDLNTGSRA